MAADIDVMTAIGNKHDQFVFIEYGFDHGNVGQMASAMIGIILNEYISRVDVLDPEFFHQAFQCQFHAGNQNRDMLILDHDLAFRIKNSAGIVITFIKNVGVACAPHGDSHFTADSMQNITQDAKRNTVNAHILLIRH